MTTPKRTMRIPTLLLVGLTLVVLFVGALMSGAGSAQAAPGGAETPAIAAGRMPAVGEDVCSSSDCASMPWEDAWRVEGLPAWKWRDIDLDIDTSGWFGTGKIKEVPVIIAEILFNIANFVWSALLALLKFGFEADALLRVATGAINAGGAFIGGRILFLSVLFAALALWRVVRSFLGGKGKAGGFVPAFRTTAIFVVMFGALYTITVRSIEAHELYEGDVDGQLTVSGTLPWAASEVLDLADKITNPLTAPVIGNPGEELAENNDAVGIVSGAVESSLDVDNEPISCTKYVAAMHAEYGSSPQAERTLIVVSRLWESTFLDSWKFAALGGPVQHRRVGDSDYTQTDIPSRMMCHWAEAVNGADPLQQQAIARAAYGSAIPEVTSDGMPVFGPFDATTVKERRKAMTAWGACTYRNGAWTGHSDFDGAWKEEGTANEYTENDYCKQVFADGEDLEDKKLNIFGGDVGDAAKKGDAVQLEQTKPVRSYGIALSGANPGGRILHAAVSLVVAGLFVWSLGFIGIGLVASMLMAIACLIFALPVGFGLAAAGKTEKAVPLFKITLTSLLAESFFTIVLSTIVILSGLFQNLIGAFNSIPVTLLSLMNGAAPVAAFMLVRKLMKSLGMADIFSASGALTFAASAAAATSGKAEWKNKALAGRKGEKSDFQKMAGKTPWLGKKLNKADRYAPTVSNWNKQGRGARAEANANDEQERQERIRQRMAERGDTGRMARMRNKVDNLMLPSDTKDRMKGILKNGGLLAATGLATGGIGVGLLLAGKAGQAGRKALRNRRGVGDPVDPDETDAVDFTAGAVHGGRDAGPRRAATVAETNGYVEDTIDRVYKDMKAADPSSSITDRMRQGVETAIADMMGAYAENLTGSRRMLTDSEIDGLRVSVARELGYSPAGIVATTGGVPMVIPYEPGRARTELAPEQLKNFVHWLPEEDRVVRAIPTTMPDGSFSMRPENAEEYAARLFAIGVARGVIHPDGSSVDVLSLNGLDIADPTVRVRVEAWQSGNADAILDNLRIGAINDAFEQRLVYAAQNVANAQALGRTTTAGAPTAATPAAPAPASAVDPALTTQLILAVNAAKELLEEARLSGSGTELAAAASKVAATIEKLESNQEQLINQLSDSMADSLEKQLALQAGRDTEFNSKFETLFSDGIDGIAGEIAAVRRVLGDFTAGVLPMSAAVQQLTTIVGQVNQGNADSTRKIAEALAEQSRVLGNWGTTRGGATWAPPSARKAVDEAGGTQMPGDE